ncbi:hypothetical protein Snoj_04610 [Streptomyces nojiriensis]|uniref:Uncharacterized protein n=1 Tax=Streptomyces nojiriensis TaxID=66374 RepID=A0ABQ3SEJ8_9ACTN|nr:hypothetical protein [Streptomyces nojiriensis]QTI48192.1 hypothetical protein JYK04_06052 [Streptomyces nojiriensis]GGS26024.1 hypothetical protein GCM10010205_65080 [Streptomyces nojiriensis]GHI66543.1 hypothetical protein Snoj_04610 [Streptomyces nojiriensis]
MLTPFVTPSELPTVPVRIEDVPPGWLANLANWSIFATALAAFATIFVPIVVRWLSGAKLDVVAERDDQNVYVRLANKGGSPASIRKVFLGVLRPTVEGGPKDRPFNLYPNVKAENLDPFVLGPGEYKLLQMTWPGENIQATTYDHRGEMAHTPAAETDVRVIVRLYMGFKGYPVKLEPHLMNR